MKTHEVSTKTILELHDKGHSDLAISSIVGLPKWAVNLVITNREKMGS